jgi:acyl CoA:acetate/3-ketoacid CoA transferase
MRRRRIWLRRLTKAAATVVVGAMLGFLVPSVLADVNAKPEVQAQSAESPVARQFITAFVADDQATLDLLQIGADTKAKASRFKAEYVKVDPPVHLGSWIIGGGLTLHAYAAHVVDQSGVEDQLAWRVATGAGSVGLIDPPASTTTP